MKYVEGLRTMNLDDVVIICDAYDLFAVKSSTGMLQKFYSLDADIVVGAEYCTGENVAPLDDWYDFHGRPVHPTLPHLNAGFVMGKVFRLIEMYEFISQRDDDQIAMGEYFRTNPWRLAVDFDRKFVYNHQYTLQETPTEAFFIHYPGYKYMPETTIAYMKRLKAMLGTEKEDSEDGAATPEESESPSTPEETTDCEFSIINSNVKSPGELCALESICIGQGSGNELDTLAEASQMSMSLDQLAPGMAGKTAPSMTCNSQQNVMPSACHVVDKEALNAIRPLEEGFLLKGDSSPIEDADVHLTAEH